MSPLAVLQPLERRLLLAADWRFIVVGDSRGSDAGGINATILSELANRAVAEGAKFVVFPGDLVTTGSLSAFQAWQAAWKPAYDANIGLAAVAGNHDAPDLTDFKSMFITPLQAAPFTGEQNFVLDTTTGDQRSYSFNYQNALFLGLDNYLNGSTGTHAVNQAFVNARVAALNRSTTPLVFSYCHEPAFKIGQDTGLEKYVTQRDAFWQSLKNVGSRSFFAGHDHLYVHTQLVDNPNDSNPNNDVHQFVVGSGGAPLYPYLPGADSGGWTMSNVYNESQYGYMRVDVHNNTVTQTWVHRTGTNAYAATAEVFTYTVNALPTIDAIANRSIAKNLPAQAMGMTGISAGINDTQAIAISASSSNTALIPNPTVTYTSGNTTGTLNYSPAAGQTGSATITVTVRDAGLDGSLNTADDGITTRSFTITIVPPPKVTGSNYQYATVPQTLSFTFDSDVGASLATGDLALTDAGGVPVSASFSSLNYDPATKTAVWTLSATLPNDNYRAVLLASGISDAVNNALDGNGDGTGGDNYVLPFFQLLGDANRDRQVNFTDLVAVAQHYNTLSGATWDIGDFNGDGMVDFTDLVAVAQNYNKTLPVPAAIADGPASGAGATTATVLTAAGGGADPVSSAAASGTAIIDPSAPSSASGGSDNAVPLVSSFRSGSGRRSHGRPSPKLRQPPRPVAAQAPGTSGDGRAAPVFSSRPVFLEEEDLLNRRADEPWEA